MFVFGIKQLASKKRIQSSNNSFNYNSSKALKSGVSNPSFNTCSKLIKPSSQITINTQVQRGFYLHVDQKYYCSTEKRFTEEDLKREKEYLALTMENRFTEKENKILQKYLETLQELINLKKLIFSHPIEFTYGDQTLFGLMLSILEKQDFSTSANDSLDAWKKLIAKFDRKEALVQAADLISLYFYYKVTRNDFSPIKYQFRDLIADFEDQLITEVEYKQKLENLLQFFNLDAKFPIRILLEISGNCKFTNTNLRSCVKQKEFLDSINNPVFWEQFSDEERCALKIVYSFMQEQKLIRFIH